MSPEIRRPEFPPVVAGTAGHVDHGKTSLVRLLTGCDTDKLPEEKRRGMSINLGFAPCLLPGNRTVGIVDVPGHIDFIRNMVAGAATIDIVILVVAADDGVMPQTIEHLRIARLLGARKMMAALTKIDLVDPEIVELAAAELEEFLKSEGFPGAAVIPVSNINGDGISRIREELDRLLVSVSREADHRVFRMNIERAFTVKGIGAVASGVPISGKIAAGERLVLLPSGRECGVRAVQNYRHDSTEAAAHICTALNLRDLTEDELGRGMTLATNGIFKSTATALAVLKNISPQREIRHNSELQFYSGTSEMSATLSLLSERSLPPGSSGIVRLKFSSPLVLATGDRYILRRLSPSETVAGGEILAPSGFIGKRTAPLLQARLAKAAEALAQGELFGAALLAGPQAVLTKAEALRISGLLPEHGATAVKEKCEDGTLADLGEAFLLVRARSPELAEALTKMLAQYHRKHKYSFGMDFADAARGTGLPSICLQRIIALFAPKEQALFSSNFGRLALATFKPAINRRQLQAKEALTARLVADGAKAPARGTLIKELQISAQDLDTATAALVEEGAAVAFGNHLISSNAFAKCKEIAAELSQKDGYIDISSFKEVSGAGRNISVAILEKMDSLGITRRVGEKRIFAAGRKKI
ncbi:MAG: selenocysteine-specific translation elongation factor [Lentisphaerae bacterium GWF2_52_8]|nr:MAG: selenocysteine-specific translation elongation factor [Lentisphaerae bacterium GWF2_52_8]